MDAIPAWVGVASPLGATLTIFWLVFTGRLIPRATHDQVVKVLQDRNAEVVLDRNNWKDGATLANKTGGDLAETNKALIETARFSTHVMAALQENAGGAAHVLPTQTH